MSVNSTESVLGNSKVANKCPRRKGKLPRYCVRADSLGVVLGMSTRTIRALDAAGKLPRPLRLNGAVLWYLPEIRRWLEAGAPDRDRWEELKARR